jgi:probable H4MPT-linked C1 transfer pathway protein
MTTTIGYDVGGAHLKIARLENGRPVAVRQIVCPLWQGLDKLDAALAEAVPGAKGADRVAVTMTGELSDLFPDRATGVATLVDRLSAAHGPATRFWMGRLGFGDAAAAKASFLDVAATNFLATAEAAGGKRGDALLVDLGSTTTDIIPIRAGHAAPRGLTDYDRLASGELVYTGLTRTALMAIAPAASFKGRRQRLAREYLATAADARRVVGQLPEGVDQHATADGRGTSVEESAARLARMFCRDMADGTLADWRESARDILEQQIAAILDGVAQVLARSPLAADAPVIAAGIGADVAADIARRIGRTSVSFGDLTGASPEVALWATRCAPAVAVAMLSDRD